MCLGGIIPLKVVEGQGQQDGKYQGAHTYNCIEAGRSCQRWTSQNAITLSRPALPANRRQPKPALRLFWRGASGKARAALW